MNFQQQLQFSIYVLCTNLEAAEHNLPLEMNQDGWRKAAEDDHNNSETSNVIEMNQMRWNTLRKLENIILRIFPVEYQAKYRCEILQVASILEKTMHRLAPSYQAYCECCNVQTLCARFKSLTITYAVKVMRNDAKLRKYLALFKSKKVVRRRSEAAFSVGAGAA